MRLASAAPAAEWLALVRERWSRWSSGGIEVAIDESWNRAVGRLLHVDGVRRGDDWAFTARWSSGLEGWTAEHYATCPELLAALRCDTPIQWARPSLACAVVDRPAFRCVEQVGMPIPACTDFDGPVRVRPSEQADIPDLCRLVTASRGGGFVSAEEIDSPFDVGAGVARRYAQVGLQASRRVWLAFVPWQFGPVGVLVARRAPLGFSLRMLENRADLILRDDLTDTEAVPVCRALLAAAREDYADFAPQFIPLIVDGQAFDAVSTLGAGWMGSLVQLVPRGGGLIPAL